MFVSQALADILISTHALREEGDTLYASIDSDRLISTHALREEGDLILQSVAYTPTQFLPTPSARRATTVQDPLAGNGQYFYPRPPRGGRRSASVSLIA